MNYGELKTAILSDSHREDYSAHIARFVNQGEALIAASLDGYPDAVVVGEAARTSYDDSRYSLPPARIAMVQRVTQTDVFRHIPQIDHALVRQYRSAQDIVGYAIDNTHILFAGVPALNAEFTVWYLGTPPLLTNDSDTNQLLTDYPQLYIEAAQVYVFKRARNLEMSSAMFQSVQSLIRDINRKTKKRLSGAQTANPYNVSFRSSY